ncbi:hypothetical protein ACFQZF_06105 [Flavobacterium myungsuense]|uniref:Uncharacterized protein n=1 Tax=Flavobacterium myungsuense TaxID=651823 RepID=A0ABW3J3K8_9FLAO
MSETHLLVKSHNLELKQNLAAAIADRFRTDSPVDDHFKNADLKMAPWISERSNDRKFVKYVGQPYWTKAAIEHYKQHRTKGLRHEHAVPRKLIIKLLEESDKSKEAIFSILDNLVHAVIVTKEEATLLDKKWKSTMPVGIEITNDINMVFSRYIAMNIKVYYLEKQNPKDIKELKSLKPII